MLSTAGESSSGGISWSGRGWEEVCFGLLEPCGNVAVCLFYVVVFALCDSKDDSLLIMHAPWLLIVMIGEMGIDK